MSKETLVGVAWAVGILLAMGGIFWYEAATFEQDEYTISYVESVTWQNSTGTLAVTESDTVSYNLSKILGDDASNVASIQVHLIWNDPIGQNDEFELSMNGACDDSQLGSADVLVILCTIQPMPEQQTVEAFDEADALTHAKSTPIGAENLSNVTVTLLQAPGATLPVVGVEDPSSTDGSNDYELRFKIIRYEAVIA